MQKGEAHSHRCYCCFAVSTALVGVRPAPNTLLGMRSRALMP